MQEFCRYPDLLRHSSSFIEHFARTFLAGCVKAINLFLRGNPSPGVSAPIVDRQRFRYGDDVTLAFKAFAKAIPCLTPFLATSDPSVLKRILAYIRGLPSSALAIADAPFDDVRWYRATYSEWLIGSCP